MEQTSLNAEQKKAVVATEGPLLILAGAGSGKTKALTHRIAYLLDECHVSPYEILALTFTNKAAHEMKERIELLEGELGSRVWVSTFHACCARILRVNIEELGTFTRNFVIYDETDQLALIKQIQVELKINDEVVSKRVLRSIFSQAKNCSVSPEQYIAELDSRMSETYVQAYCLYQRTLQKNNALDFDDLLLRTMELFDRCSHVLEHYQQRFRYVHVDEYQDTNAIQYEFVKKLSAGFGNLCVVGDDDQSIYGWRGADLRNILEFEKDYSNATVLRLEQNYRSTKTILDAANAVIAQNKARKKKTLWTENEMGESIVIYKAQNDRDEANFVCDKITELTRGAERCDTCAVLYRTNAQARVLEDTLVAYGIPYVVYGSLRFYDRKEIKDILAFLRLMINPDDDISLRRVINVPKRGIGDASVNELAQCANERGISLFEACLQSETLDLKTRARKKIIDFGHLLAQLQALSELLPLCDFMNELMTLTKYLDYLQEEAKKEGKADETRVDNVQELLHAIAEFEENFSDTENVLAAYLENVALVANVKGEENADAVVLMTIHSAKGLEFPTVFVVGCEEEIFPSSRSKFSEELLEEERRLCYVAMTRAKERLFLSHARSRMQYNNFKYNPPSRFLEEIPPELCLEIKEEKETTEFSFARTTQQFKPESKQYGSASVASAKRETKTTKKNAIHFEIGQTVKHAKFGEGNIVDMAGNVLTIDFKENGTKKIAGNYAPLTIKE